MAPMRSTTPNRSVESRNIYTGVPKSPSNLRATDRELREREFTVEDPENLHSLEATLPADYLDADIEYWYDARSKSGSKRQYVWCAHDQKRTHWCGYVMRTPSGTRFLLGKDCGEKLFGLNFEEIAKDFHQLRERQSLLVRQDVVIEALPLAISDLKVLSNHENWDVHQSIIKILKAELHDLYRALTACVFQREGMLVVEERVRDFAKEEQRAEIYEHEDGELARAEERRKAGLITLTALKKIRQNAKEEVAFRDTEPIFKTVEKPIAALSGRELFRPGAAPKTVVREQVFEVERIAEELSSGTDAFSNMSLSNKLRRLRRALENLEVETQRVADVDKFCSQNNLENVISWANQNTKLNGRYRVKGRGIEFSGERSAAVMIKLPTPIVWPNRDGLDVLENALNGNPD